MYLWVKVFRIIPEFSNSIESQPQNTEFTRLYRGSYMSACVLLNLLNKSRKRDKMQGLPSILSFSQ